MPGTSPVCDQTIPLGAAETGLPTTLSSSRTFPEGMGFQDGREADVVTLNVLPEEATAVVSVLSTDQKLSNGSKKDAGFWLIIFALCMATWLAAVDLAAVSTALPTIIAAL
ncbi:hypothetical protein DACRYDRAFT_107829 [Dacryopinax primogenitus]|uniref:Uncharacterized protein n=1 Tax=Dacryopinax primogenitus (strain DJM 731) TaxID=1858805 RepID=M5G625_DACPD|nr:uncharacterized protein DACRYDRAFT_107829 [Dacryopinax primogenitus]EJU01272.1 hypothetical protein DACRYDRAFT_107829 [Dacryopinax primogenitus]